MSRKATFVAAMLVMGLNEVHVGPDHASRPLADLTETTHPRSAPPQARQAVLQDTWMATTLTEQDRPLAARTAPGATLERVESGGARPPSTWSPQHRPTLYRF